MLALLSPAKTLDYDSTLPTEKHSLPRLLSQSEQLIERCSQLSASQIARLMSVSDKIAQQNVERFRDWQPDFNLGNARQAIYAFKGDVYTGLDAYQLPQHQIEYAQQHLRMLSGLYGLLRPLDLMMPYRLEMGTKLDNPRGANLYEFWGDAITEQINKDVALSGSNVVLNLASEEYFKAVQPKKLDGKLVKVVFLDQKNGQYKVISFYAKKARGLMARFVLEQQIDQVDGLKDFQVDGYYFDTVNSNDSELVFKRDEIVA